MSLFCLMQELYKYTFKGKSPGDAYVEELPLNASKYFNSTTVQGRANVAKATFALLFVSGGTLLALQNYLRSKSKSVGV